jgi:cyclase
VFVPPRRGSKGLLHCGLTTSGNLPPARQERYSGGVRPLADGITAWLTPNGGWGESNTVLISGKRSSLLVDTLWDLPRTAAMLSGFASRLATAPIVQVVNTHADGDHWFGNQLTGATEIIATKSAARHMRKHGPRQIRSLASVSRLFRIVGCLPVPQRRSWGLAADYLREMFRPFDFSEIRPLRPNSTFSGKLQLDVSGRHVQLVEVGPAHTSGDLVVYLPDDGVVAAGDVLFFGSTPILWDGSARNWVHACERILAWKVEAVVPGHGPVTDLAGVDLVRKYWQFLRGAVRYHFDRGRSPYVAAMRIATSDDFLKQPFASWDCPERIVVNVHSMYRRLLGRSRRLGSFERIMLLRKAALMASELPQRAASDPSAASA